jgi:hypothetical protein
MALDPQLGSAVKSYRKYSAAGAARLLLSWVVEHIDGDEDEPTWRRIEALGRASLSAVLLALADDRRQVVAARLEDRHRRGI